MSDCCGGDTVLIYACSGASDVGEITDRVARKLSGDVGKMTCLAAAGAHMSGFVESAKGASANLVIDGCPVKCAAKLLEHIGSSAQSFVLTEMGLKKGSAPADDKTVADIAAQIKKKLLKTGDAVQTKTECAPPSSGGCSCGGSCG